MQNMPLFSQMHERIGTQAVGMTYGVGKVLGTEGGGCSSKGGRQQAVGSVLGYGNREKRKGTK